MVYRKKTKSNGITAKVTKGLHSEQTDFQKLDMIQTEEFGNMLVLDSMVMTTEKDEFINHEMIVHVPLFTHPNPKKVLFVGGGDGGTIREVLKHPSIEKVSK
jgi:spermidine synthase